MNSVHIQKLLDTCPITQKTLRTVLIDNVGSLDPKLYEIPRPENVVKINEFIDTLVSFENNALAVSVDTAMVNQLLTRLTGLMEELELVTIRSLESAASKNWIMFAPRPTGRSPVKIAMVLVYRFGFIKDQPGPGTGQDRPVGPGTGSGTVDNLGLISEHSIADGTESLTAELFLKCNAKFIVANFFRPHAVPNPEPLTGPHKGIKYLTDPAHSDTTIFLPVLVNLFQKKFTKMPVIIMHGMGDPLGKEYQVLMGNCYPRFRKDGWRSFANLLAISFGTEDYYTSPENKEADLPSPVVVVQGYIPNSVLKAGKTVPMSSTPGMTNGALGRTQGAITSNVSGHIRYFAENPFGLILKDHECPDNAIHMETTGFIRTNKLAKSPNRDKFVKVVMRAMRWYHMYDPCIHDPYRLFERFPERSRNMKLYDQLFSQTVISRYKLKKSEIYAADAANYQTVFGLKKQLPPAPK
jgi:hypothetical protein